MRCTLEIAVTAPYTFEIEIAISNDQGHEETIFLGGVNAACAEDIIENDLHHHLGRARSMLDERADDGAFWGVDVKCLSVVDVATSENDWNNDLLPQRDDVTRLLESIASQSGAA